jgi:hypothetical protein
MYFHRARGLTVSPGIKQGTLLFFIHEDEASALLRNVAEVGHTARPHPGSYCVNNKLCV